MNHINSTSECKRNNCIMLKLIHVRMYYIIYTYTNLHRDAVVSCCSVPLQVSRLANARDCSRPDCISEIGFHPHPFGSNPYPGICGGGFKINVAEWVPRNRERNIVPPCMFILYNMYAHETLELLLCNLNTIIMRSRIHDI